MSTVSVTAPDGVPEVGAGDDLAALLLPLVDLADGDVVVVTSKVVSKAEGRVRPGDRDEAVAGETVRVVARRGPTTIARTRHGLTMAAAGVDASNTALGSIVLLPEDPDASARALRATLHARAGRNVGVVVTDTAGRAWREGQTDIAVGVAGLRPLEDFGGRVDAHGNPLAVTAPAVADEIAGMAELAQGKLGGRPFAVVRGRADLVLAPGEDGPGARALVRPDHADMFGYGAREAVLCAVRRDPAGQPPFGSPVPAEELAGVLAGLGAEVRADEGGLAAQPGPGVPAEALAAVAFAHGWQTVPADSSVGVRLRPATT